MKTDNDKIDNEIWYNFFIRSANSLTFDLINNSKQVKNFSDEQLCNLTAICDNIFNKSKIFREELEKRIKIQNF